MAAVTAGGARSQAMATTPPPLARNARITGAARAELAAELAGRYQAGESIRALCTSTGYSIGRVRRLLVEADVTFRARGGAHRRGTRAGSG